MLFEDSFVRLLGLGYVLRFEHLHAKWYFLTEPRCIFFSYKLGSSLRRRLRQFSDPVGCSAESERRSHRSSDLHAC